MEEMSISPDSAIKTVAKVAEESGIEEGVLWGWIKKAKIPTVKYGRHRVINNVQWFKELQAVDDGD